MDDASLRKALHTAQLSQTDGLLVVLLSADEKPQAVRLIRDIAVSHGLRDAKKWNISQLLKRSNGRALLVAGGWQLTSIGKQHLFGLGVSSEAAPAAPAKELRALLPKIVAERNREFVAEAVSSYENKNLRAAAVLAWVGAVSILYDFVVQHALAKFSAEWVRRNPQKNKPITNVDDLSDLKEDTFIDVLHAVSLVGKSVKDELKGCLKFRNGCGHPSTLVVGEARVAAHLETLINNVYKKF